MKNSFSILIWINKSKKGLNNKVPIYGRITVNGKRAENALNIFVEENKWDKSKQCVKGNSEDARTINRKISSFISDIRKIYERIINEDKYLSVKLIKDIYDGKDDLNVSMLYAFNRFNEDVQNRINIDYSKNTLKRYKSTYSNLSTFILETYHKEDLLLKELNEGVLYKFENYLRINKAHQQSTIYKSLQQVKTIIHYAIKNQWIDVDPFKSYKIKNVQKERECLSTEELQVLESTVIKNNTLSKVKDYFLFSCYTGLSYIDIFNLTKSNIQLGIDGNKWIRINRQKTGTSSMLPILPEALSIIEKYRSDSEKLFHVFSNQKTNQYLKRIAERCNINKRLTFHIARHTFATTVTLTNGVPIETVSKMLGHKSIRTTQIYSKVVEQKVSQDMMQLRNLLTLRKSSEQQKRQDL